LKTKGRIVECPLDALVTADGNGRKPNLKIILVKVGKLGINFGEVH